MNTADVIVIGGGIAGISAAAEIARAGSVIVLEAERQLGYHATGRSAAIAIRNYGNATLRALNAYSAPFLNAPEGVSDRTLLSPRGEMVLAAEDELDALEAYSTGATGLDVLTPAEACALVPILRREAIAAAVIEGDAQDIDVDRMLAGYHRLLKSRGGQIVVEAPVAMLTRSEGAWTVRAGSETYQAPLIVNAAGAWAGQIGQLAGAYDIALQPTRRSAAIIPAPEGHNVSAWPFFGSASERWYAKPEAGKLMVSPADEDPVDPHDAYADDMVLAEGLHRYEQVVSSPVTRVTSSWAGLRTFAPDRTPVVGFDPRADGFFWLAGQGGYGVQTAPAIARLTADLVRGGSAALPAEVLEALDPRRFLP